MFSPGISHFLCVPEYLSPENYQAFLELMTAEDRLVAKPFHELNSIIANYRGRKGLENVSLILVPVEASLWKDWCASRDFELTPVSVAYYATWLYLCGIGHLDDSLC
ncbi:hypothetical protein JIN84_21605 [Luteolibacter yonseiensis]|uniref:Uncharacterized protein n=1 Tax=Luteolibacter yonseiensis TaxID=1144680 RepID=A0A934R764_9BACT|nr:hypothetical protein [Luteolibacter yonseiensis]MBK1818234.1 hypothetical protein [Luteolibacter yonseiensis]